MSTPFSYKNNVISYNISSCPIDHYKKTVAVRLLDSLIIKMQGRLSDENRHARHLLCLVPSIIVNKALQLDDEVEGVLFWEKDIPFFSPLEMRYAEGKHSVSQQIREFPNNLLLALGTGDEDASPNIYRLLVIACSLTIT